MTQGVDRSDDAAGVALDGGAAGERIRSSHPRQVDGDRPAIADRAAAATSANSSLARSVWSRGTDGALVQPGGLRAGGAGLHR